LTRIFDFSLIRNTESTDLRPSIPELQAQIADQARDLVSFACRSPVEKASAQEMTFKAFEEALVPKIFALARTVVVLFLAAVEQRVAARTPPMQERDGRRFRRAPAIARNLETYFGVVRYWRIYMRQVAERDRHGFFPLDVILGLSADRISMTLLALAVRLATQLSFAQTRSVLTWFLPTVPSVEVIEQATLGFGHFTSQWFEQAPAPQGDGEVLIVLIDSKGAPTATEQELKRRRGKRRKRPTGTSARHRGRQHRKRYGSKKRRKKGDKSKNAKMSTLVVMYTLRRQGPYLQGPINKWVYGSFAPKRHAFAIARREADKRGFAQGSGKTVQLLTDGDPDLERYAKQYLPEAIHTIDVMHVVEKLWDAGGCLHREGSEEQEEWVERQKERLYEGQVEDILVELRYRMLTLPKTGPGNKGKRDRLSCVIGYLDKRADKMNYHELITKDLEIGTGAVEGAVKHIVGKRCDHGGMRWIKERAEAVLQLRCIEYNGDWEAFVQFVHDKVQLQGMNTGKRVRIQQNEPAPLPTTEEADLQTQPFEPSNAEFLCDIKEKAA
jgi:hypothetical protein